MNKRFYLISEEQFTKFKFSIHLIYKIGWHSNIVTGAWATCGTLVRHVIEPMKGKIKLTPTLIQPIANLVQILNFVGSLHAVLSRNCVHYLIVKFHDIEKTMPCFRHNLWNINLNLLAILELRRELGRVSNFNQSIK